MTCNKLFELSRSYQHPQDLRSVAPVTKMVTLPGQGWIGETAKIIDIPIGRLQRVAFYLLLTDETLGIKGYFYRYSNRQGGS